MLFLLNDDVKLLCPQGLAHQLWGFPLPPHQLARVSAAVPEVLSEHVAAADTMHGLLQ
jgi:hypothetical protein